jgi:hypothetical protein
MDDALLAFEGQAVDVGATYTHGCCAERQSFDQVRATAHAPPTHGKVIGIVGRPKSLFKKDLVLVIPELIQVSVDGPPSLPRQTVSHTREPAPDDATTIGARYVVAGSGDGPNLFHRTSGTPGQAFIPGQDHIHTGELGEPSGGMVVRADRRPPKGVGA